MTTHFEPLFFGVSTNQPSKTSSWKIPLMNHLFVHNTIEFTYHYKHSMSHLSKNCVKFTRYKKMRRTSFHTEGSASTDAVWNCEKYPSFSLVVVSSISPVTRFHHNLKASFLKKTSWIMEIFNIFSSILVLVWMSSEGIWNSLSTNYVFFCESKWQYFYCDYFLESFWGSFF